MKPLARRLVWGLLIWGVPFIASLLVWDVENGGPAIPLNWFYVVMGITGTIAFSFAAWKYFGATKLTSMKEAWTTGLTWYTELLALDFLILVLAFGMTFADYVPMFVTYLNPLVLSLMIAKLR